MLTILNRFFVLFFYCFIALAVSANEIKNDPNTLTKQDITEWQLVDITYLPNTPLDDLTLYTRLNEVKNISVKSSDSKLILDENHIINVHQVTDNLSPRSHELLQKVLEHLKLTGNQQENQYFDFVTLPKQYNLNPSLVLISDYLFLFTNDDIVLAFKLKQKMRETLATIYEKLNIIDVPLNNYYWGDEVNSNNDIFLPITDTVDPFVAGKVGDGCFDEFNYFFKGMIDDDCLKALKLKSYKKIKLLLLSSVAINSAERLSLISLSDDFNLIDRLEIGETSELEDGGIWSEYFINKNYRITIKHFNSPYDYKKRPTALVSKIHYVINKQGKFVKVKR
jgi:hypothetical protein